MNEYSLAKVQYFSLINLLIINFVDNTRNLYNLIELRGFVIVVSVVVRFLIINHFPLEFQYHHWKIPLI